MNALKQHIIFRGLTILLVLAFLLPTAAKFMHVFEDHLHEVCLGESESHFHSFDVECEFYQFKLNAPFTIPENNAVVLKLIQIEKSIPTHYSFLSEYQNLHFSLRGPPSINLI